MYEMQKNSIRKDFSTGYRIDRIFGMKCFYLSFSCPWSVTILLSKTLVPACSR